MSAVSEIVPAFLRREIIKVSTHGVPERFLGAGSGFSEQLLQLSKRHLDRIVMTTLDCWFVLRPERRGRATGLFNAMFERSGADGAVKDVFPLSERSPV